MFDENTVYQHSEPLFEEYAPSNKINVSIMDTAQEKTYSLYQVPATFFADGSLELPALLETLKLYNVQIDRNMIYYYSPFNDMHIYCGRDPVHPHTTIPAHDIQQSEGHKWISIKIRYVELQTILKNDPTPQEEMRQLLKEDSDSEDDSVVSGQQGAKRRRHKERNIGEVLDLVHNWRKLYAGIRDPDTNQIIKLSLDEAAKKVGVAKKSLDDYLL